MHDRLLDYLNRVADVHLVSRLKDERLNFPHKDDIRIFLPDMHLISKDRDKEFKYGTNHPALLAKLAEELKEFKKETGDAETVFVYQLGDFIDLWRETPSYWSVGGQSDEWEASVQQILDDNSPVINPLRDPDLGTQFILGNHDIDLYRLPSFAGWNLKYYFPLDLEKGASAAVFHGDIFSMFEKIIPDGLQYLAVHIFGPLVKPSVKDLGTIRDVIIKAHNKRKYSNYIQRPAPSGPDNLITLGSEPLPERHNVKEKGITNEEELTYLKEAEDFGDRVNEEMGWNLRMAVIGHTHYARIAVDESDNKFFTLLDCGAWIERCSVTIEGEEKEMENAQIGALNDNDVRIYQLSPKET